MSKEVIRPIHGMVARRVIGAIKGEVPAYMGNATAFVIEGVSCIVMTTDVLDLKRISEKLKAPFSMSKVAHVAMLHSGYAKLADTGWEKQEPLMADDFDPEDDEL